MVIDVLDIFERLKNKVKKGTKKKKKKETDIGKSFELKF